jgi:hypothetical protein
MEHTYGPLCIYYGKKKTCYVKETLEKFNQNLNNYNYDTLQRKHFYLSYCRTKVCKNSVNNTGQKKIFLHFRRKLKLFLLQQTFYSVEEYFMYKN